MAEFVSHAPTLHVAFCANDAYVPYLCVALRGIAANHRGEFNVHVHIFTDGFSAESEQRIRSALGIDIWTMYTIHIVDDTPLRGLKVRHYTKYTWYRMLIPDILPDVDKILYLDTDVAIADDLQEAFDFDITPYSIATAPDTDTVLDEPYERCGYPKELGYICAGVMLINLDYWRKNDIARKVIAWGRENADRLKCPDQDSINYVCRDSKGYLPLRWGVTRSLFTQPVFYTPEYKQQMLDALHHPVVVHYAGCAPWLKESDHPLLDIWIEQNSSLDRPAQRRYAAKGMLRNKQKVWDMLHPGERRAMTPAEIEQKINAIPAPNTVEPKRKPRLLFFIESLQCGGAEKSLVSLLQMLDPKVYDVDLMLLRRKGLFLRYVPQWVNIIKFPATPKARFRQAVFAAKWRAFKALGIKRHNAETRWPLIGPTLPGISYRYDAAIAYQQGFPTYYIATKVNADKKLAWVNIDLQGAGYREKFNRPYYDSYDNIVAVSQELYDKLSQSAYLDRARLVTVYDILNVDLIRSMASEAEPATDTDKVRLVTVGRLSRQKNYPLAVETARILRDRGLDFTWTFVGEGAERPAIESLIAKYNLADRVIMAGEQANPYTFMREADIYVHTASFEGFGLTIAEAKILGKPVVSTDFRIVYDQITDGVNGLIAEQTPESVADKIMLMVGDTDLRQRITDAIKSEVNTTSATEVDKFNSLIQ